MTLHFHWLHAPRWLAHAPASRAVTLFSHSGLTSGSAPAARQSLLAASSNWVSSIGSPKFSATWP